MAQSKRGTREDRESRQRLRDYTARQTLHTEQRQRRRRDNWIAAVAAVVVIGLAAAAQILYFTAGPGVPVASPEPTPSASASAAATGANTGNVPDASIAEGRTWTGDLVLNDVDLGISLDGATAPQGVSAFISLAQDGFYTGKNCHRLTNAGFSVLQCGAVNSDGSGDAGFEFGPVEAAPADNVYPAGTIALARQSGNAYSNSTQFFIVYEDTTIPADEAGGYTVLGTVTSGLDQLKTAITDAGTADGSSDGAPSVATTITSVTVQ